MAKVEGNTDNWHGHVTCLSVAPEFRRQGVSKELMNVFEKISEMFVIFNSHLYIKLELTIEFNFQSKLVVL
jgi:ribosomal protein S18 acetylase RimI-like enzyme